MLSKHEKINESPGPMAPKDLLPSNALISCTMLPEGFNISSQTHQLLVVTL